MKTNTIEATPRIAALAMLGTASGPALYHAVRMDGQHAGAALCGTIRVWQEEQPGAAVTCMRCQKKLAKSAAAAAIETPAENQAAPSTGARTAQDELARAYAHFNAALFGNRLPAVLIVPRVTNAKRKNGVTLGYFHAERWSAAGELVHELAMNAEVFGTDPVRDVLATLVHEMVHVQQQMEGKPTRNGYHNAEWGQMMRAVGLEPSNTGKPGGKTTGQQMHHYIVEGGAFAQACRALLDGGFRLTWHDRAGKPVPVREPVDGEGEGAEGDPEAEGAEPAPAKPKSGKRWKYACPECSAAAWGKEGLALICGACKVDFEPVTE